MPAKVTLTVTAGKLRGKVFAFDERATCLIGRSEDCQIRLPSDQDHRLVSRNHCLLDLNPPDVRIRDFGSRNGTYVNGVKIGQRATHQAAEEARTLDLPEHDLQDGDEIQLGKTVLRVGIVVPTVCSQCRAEIPDELRAAAEQAPGVYRCAACRRHEETLPVQSLDKPGQACSRCGSDVTLEMDARRPGDFVCAACHADPGRVVQGLLEQANAGDGDLMAIKGYEVLKELGRGGMGAVYLARHLKSGEQVALKVLLPQVATDATARARFLREVETTRALKHPHVVQLRDAGSCAGTFFLTLDYCDGGSVVELVQKRGGTVPAHEAVPLILQALAGLEYAHNLEIPQMPGRGVVHRDIKPNNLFLSGTGKARLVKIGDFGLAKAFDTVGLSGYTRTGAVSGTPYYMPRPQLVNFKNAKPEVDVWGMAATLYFMLTGCPPRDFPPGMDWCRVLLETAAVPVRQRDPWVPARLAEVIDLALVDKPAIHFQTAAEFRRALEAAA